MSPGRRKTDRDIEGIQDAMAERGLEGQWMGREEWQLRTG
jgi:hypothetical protein